MEKGWVQNRCLLHISNTAPGTENVAWSIDQATFCFCRGVHEA